MPVLAKTLAPFEEVEDEIAKSEHYFELIKNILALTNNEFVLANLAAGPLQIFLVHHGRNNIAMIEAYAANNTRFRNLLKGVWKNAIDTETWLRIQKARL